MVVSARSQQTVIPTTVVNEVGGRLLRRFEAMHRSNPEVNHFAGFICGPQFSDIGIQRYFIILWPRSFLLLSLGFDMIPDLFQVLLLFLREL